MRAVNTNDLKNKGISVTAGEEETFVMVRIDRYESVAEKELALAVVETEADYNRGDYVTEEVDKLIKRVTK